MYAEMGKNLEIISRKGEDIANACIPCGIARHGHVTSSSSQLSQNLMKIACLDMIWDPFKHIALLTHQGSKAKSLGQKQHFL